MSLSSAKPSLASRRQAPAAADVLRVPNHRRINLAPGHLAHLELLPLRVAACPSAHGIVLLARCNRSSWAGARACAQPLFPAGRHGRSHTRVLPSVSVAQCPHARLLPLVSTAATPARSCAAVDHRGCMPAHTGAAAGDHAPCDPIVEAVPCVLFVQTKQLEHDGFY